MWRRLLIKETTKLAFTKRVITQMWVFFVESVSHSRRNSSFADKRFFFFTKSLQTSDLTLYLITKVARLSALLTGRLCPPEKIPGTHSF
jgi:hypothetical protein